MNANFVKVHLVVRLFWEVVPIANKVAEILGIVAQHVAYLTTSIRSVLSSLDPSIGCLLQKKDVFGQASRTYPQTDESKIGCISVRPPLGPERLSPWRALDGKGCITELLNISLVPSKTFVRNDPMHKNSLLCFSCELIEQQLSSWKFICPVKGPGHPGLLPAGVHLLGLGQVGRVLGGLVQPGCSPNQLIFVSVRAGGEQVTEGENG